MYGLNNSELTIIRELLSQYPQVKQAILFGSRALDTYKQGSDVDIALKGDNLPSIITDISSKLNEETPLPFFFDILDYNTITHQPLIEHIERVGISIYP